MLKHLKVTCTPTTLPEKTSGELLWMYQDMTTIIIDMIVQPGGCENLTPPFGRPDFRCNMLQMTQVDGEFVFKYPAGYPGNVDLAIDDIEHKEAVVLGFQYIPDHIRFVKMARKRYLIDCDVFFEHETTFHCANGETKHVKITKKRTYATTKINCAGCGESCSWEKHVWQYGCHQSDRWYHTACFCASFTHTTAYGNAISALDILHACANKHMLSVPSSNNRI